MPLLQLDSYTGTQMDVLLSESRKHSLHDPLISVKDFFPQEQLLNQLVFLQDV